jgi:serine/threonine protein kinase
MIYGMQHYFDMEVIHRDLKPDNIMIGADGRVRIVDFGICAKIGAGSKLTEADRGTLLYMAPEVWTGKPYTQKADVWSLGCLLYFLVTRVDAFDHESRGMIFKNIKKANYKPLPNDTDPELCDLIQHLLEKDPLKRFDLY